MEHIDGKTVFVTDSQSNCWICLVNEVKDGLLVTEADYCVATGTMTKNDTPRVFGHTDTLSIRDATDEERRILDDHRRYIEKLKP